MKIMGAAIGLAFAAASGAAQTPPSEILISASGTAQTPPDMVTVGFMLRGEGATSDEAVTRLRDNAKALSAGVAGLLQKAEDYHSSQLAIGPVRGKECDQNNYGQQRLSTGVCYATKAPRAAARCWPRSPARRHRRG